MSGGERKGRRAFLDHFKENGRGSYTYEGSLFYYGGEEKARRRQLAALWLLCVWMLAASAVNGCIPAPGMDGCAYVMLPYAGGLITAVLLTWTTYRLSAGGNPLREYVYQSTAEKYPFRAKLRLILSVAAICGELACVILSGTGGKGAYAALFLVLEASSAFAALMIRRIAGAQIWEKDGPSS